MKRKIFLVFAFTLSIFFSYCTYVVLVGRATTTEIVEVAKSKIQNPISKNDLSDAQLKALLAVQDPNFFSHGGTDFLHKRMTTITQALVKLLYFEKFRPGFAKIKQSLLARFALDPLVSKDEQLALFLNLTYFGEFKSKEVIGFSGAAQTYFSKPLQDLSQDKFLQLLAMLFGPNLYNVKTNPAKNAEQVALIQKSLSSED